MIRSPTVLIVGAGASAELEFPSGAGLLRKIATLLDYGAGDQPSTTNGDHLRYTYNSMLQGQAEEGWRRFYRACARLRSASLIGRSIDNVIDQNDDEPLMAFIAKIAIGITISAAEVDSPLSDVDDDDGFSGIEGIANSWLHPFAQMLTTDVQRSHAGDIFSNISIINFNYDRSIEVAVPGILQAAYGLARADAIELSKKLRVYHPYGSLGEVDFMRNGKGTPYGHIPFGELASYSRSLRTFTEKMDETEEVAAMRNLIADASNLVFLGFGYHRQNLRLIAPSLGVSATTFLGTVYGEGTPAVQSIRSDLQDFCMPAGPNGVPALELHPLSCADLLREQFRRLTS